MSYQTTWYNKQIANNPDFRFDNAAYERQRRLKDPRICLLSNARTRSKRFNLPFNLKKEDILVPALCPILKFPLETKSKVNGGRFNAPSLDRIVPELGYVKGNVWVISRQANAMKNQATKEDLRNFSNWINLFIS